MLFYQGQLCSGKVFLGELTECREEELEVYLSAFSATFFLLHQQASYIDLKSYCCSPSDIAAAWCSWAGCKHCQMTQAAAQPNHYYFVFICHSI